MATTSDTAAQTARGNGVNKLFTSKDLMPAQRRLRWVIIGIWVILAYGAVCVLVGSAPWTIWRLYGGPGRCVCRWAAARPRAVRAASFARRVSSKPGQAPPPPTGTAAGTSGTLHTGGGGGFAALEAGCRRIAGVSDL